jgi:MOSC domain-containing protein
VVAVEIVTLLVSSINSYKGRPADGPIADPEQMVREQVEVRAGRGLVGDRYFNRPAHRDASVTVIAAESFDRLREDLGLLMPIDPLVARRNIVLRGFPIDDLAARRGEPGAVFSLDSGTGPVRFQANRPANPCAWLDAVIAPGALRGLRGHGGVRCTPLDDGLLRVGPATLTQEPLRADRTVSPR